MAFKINDLDRLKQFAGIITESYADDDELSPAEKALVDKAERDLKAKGIKVKDIDPDKDIASMAKKEKAEDEVVKDTVAKKIEKKEVAKEVAKKADDKKAEEKKEEAKARGRKVGEKTSAMAAWLSANKDATRKSFIDHAVHKHGMSKHHANTLFYGLKKRLQEYYIIAQKIGGRTLAEYSSYDRPQWVMFDNEWAPNVMVFESADKAQSAVSKLVAQGWDGKVEKIVVVAE